MNTYSDLIVARGMTATSNPIEINARAQEVMEDSSLSLRARALFILLCELRGEPHNPFAEPYEPAEVIHGAVEELVTAGLVIRV